VDTQKNTTTQVKKLSFKEQKELSELPQKIEKLEIEKNKIQTLIADEKFYHQDHTVITETLNKFKQLDTDLEQLYSRWDELEKK